MSTWFSVHPRGDKLDLADDDSGPVAFFEFEGHASDFCRRMYPTTGEVHEVPRDVAERLEALRGNLSELGGKLPELGCKLPEHCGQEMQGRAA